VGRSGATGESTLKVDDVILGEGLYGGVNSASTLLVHELRRRGGGIGVAAMCAGGGMGSATVIEVPAP
jgi:hypothetical protein